MKGFIQLLHHSRFTREILVSGLFLTLAAPASLAAIVTSNSDSDAGSLRDAVSSASPGETITFTNTLAGQTIMLTSGQILIDKSLDIDASAIGGITIDGNAFGVEYALGTDWNSADITNSANLAAHPAGGAVFGFNPNAASNTAWVLKRSLDLVSDPFVEIYRYDGPTGIETFLIPSGVIYTGSGFEVEDLSGATTPSTASRRR